MKDQPKSWHTCSNCGDKFFPHANKDGWGGITVSLGDCPDCGAKDVALIPLRDFKNLHDFD